MTYRLPLGAVLAALMIAFTGCDENLNGGAGKPTDPPTEPPEPTGKLYWSQHSDDYLSVRRANLDGTGVQDVIRVKDGGRVYKVDAHRGKVYWMDSVGAPRAQKIWRANADGTAVEEVRTLGVQNTDGFNSGIDLALHGDYVYWTQSVPVTGHSLRRAKLDGTGVQEELAFAGSALYVGFDGGKMCWQTFDYTYLDETDVSRSARYLAPAAEERPRENVYVLWCGNPDGSGAAEVLRTVVLWPSTEEQELNYFRAMYDGKVFWTRTALDADGAYTRAIMRADLDGGNVESVVSSFGVDAGYVEGGYSVVRGVAAAASGLYWVERWCVSADDCAMSPKRFHYRIMRADLDGANVAKVVDLGPAADEAQYWVTSLVVAP